MDGGLDVWVNGWKDGWDGWADVWMRCTDEEIRC